MQKTLGICPFVNEVVGSAVLILQAPLTTFLGVVCEKGVDVCSEGGSGVFLRRSASPGCRPIAARVA